ncbi:e3 ubiquitin-protein ligase RNF167 [Nephila pilipes]|uniref:E3 ubiquitin-protein ligase RNF167 n=1 Tax=Nephila pilipes TaxID=299642 RepID=A0A8X6QX35_NEPPI|nr:e3 ubiquitin-protein ligase RNF167 [Nephila pilipes]
MFGKAYFVPKKIELSMMWSLYCIVLFRFIGLGEAGILILVELNEVVDQFADSELPFARPVSRNGIEGYIVSAEPPDACTKIAEPPFKNNSLNWIVLIAGNICNYHTKVKNSELAGYSAAVIYTLRGKEDEFLSHQHGFISNISAVTIRTSSGIIIKENYLYSLDKRYRILIYPKNIFDFMTFLLLFVIVSGIFLVIMLAFLVSVSQFWILLKPNNKHANRLVLTTKYLLLLTTVSFLVIFFAVPLGIVRFVQQAQSNRNSRLNTQHLRQLQVSTFKKGDPYETCAICLEDFKNKDKLRILPCLHGYHVKCIDPWLTKNKRICPICKQRVIVLGESSRNDIDSEGESRGETVPLLQNSDRSTSFASYQAVSDNAATSSSHSQDRNALGGNSS